MGELNRLRALRTVSELPPSYLQQVVACDLSETSHKVFQKNLELNGLTGNPKIRYVLSDTNKHMASVEYPWNYDVLDLDPYGSVVPFLFEAIKAATNGGMLCITCTDTRVLCGDDRHKCYYLYGSAHGGDDTIEETGIRILLYTVSRVASMQMKSVKVLLSVQSDFYIRVFVQVHESRNQCWQTIAQHGLQLHCRACSVSWVHQFGHQNQKHRYSVADFKGPGVCGRCSASLSLSWLIRRSAVDRPPLRPHLRPGDARPARDGGVQWRKAQPEDHHLQEDPGVPVRQSPGVASQGPDRLLQPRTALLSQGETAAVQTAGVVA